MNTGILLFGASQRTGLAVAEVLTARGEHVSAAVRSGSDRTALQDLGVRLFTADALDPDAVTRAFAGGHIRAVVSTIGGSRNEPRRPDFETTRNIAEAAQRHGVRRMVLVTAIGAGNSRTALSDHAWKHLGPVIMLKTQAEELLMASGLDATILRPGGMQSGPPTGSAILTTDYGAMGTINRSDLAALIVACLDDDATIGRIYHAIDPSIIEQPPLQRGEPPNFSDEKP